MVKQRRRTADPEMSHDMFIIRSPLAGLRDVTSSVSTGSIMLSQRQLVNFHIYKAFAMLLVNLYVAFNAAV